jgi:hypothetical protein
MTHFTPAQLEDLEQSLSYSEVNLLNTSEVPLLQQYLLGKLSEEEDEEEDTPTVFWHWGRFDDTYTRAKYWDETHTAYKQVKHDRPNPFEGMWERYDENSHRTIHVFDHTLRDYVDMAHALDFIKRKLLWDDRAMVLVVTDPREAPQFYEYFQRVL